jgi:hypothetical protein
MSTTVLTNRLELNYVANSSLQAAAGFGFCHLEYAQSCGTGLQPLLQHGWSRQQLMGLAGKIDYRLYELSIGFGHGCALALCRSAVPEHFLPATESGRVVQLSGDERGRESGLIGCGATGLCGESARQCQRTNKHRSLREVGHAE